MDWEEYNYNISIKDNKDTLRFFVKDKGHEVYQYRCGRCGFINQVYVDLMKIPLKCHACKK